MSRLADQSIVIASLRGGRNGADSPSELADDQCIEARNVDWWNSPLGAKRNGATLIGMTFSSGGPFTNAIESVIRHVPGADETAAELWAFDATTPANVGRLAASTAWVAPTMSDVPTQTTGFHQVTGASLGGFLFLTYHSAAGNRMHVWDPALSQVRRAGLATPAAPTLTPDGAGGLSFTRYYRVRWVDISGSDTRRRSEASSSVSATISAKAGITVNRPTLASESETHWDVEYADASTGPWYRAAQVAAATTTYDDTASAIDTTNPSPLDGINSPPPSAKYLVKIGARLVMAGAWETSGGYVPPKNNRIWWTAVIGANDVGDLERIPAGYQADVGDAITGIGGPLQGALYVFGYRNYWKLQPTGLPGADAFQVIDVNSGIGCIRHQSIVMSEDENGNPALYFWSHRGPYRLTPAGLQWIGNDILDLVATVNLGASGGAVHGVAHPEKHQIWWWIATGISNTPNTKVVFDTQLGRTVNGQMVRKGWATHDGESASARCSVLFASTLGATMGRNLVPHVGLAGTVNRIYRCDDPTTTSDNGTAFQAYLDSKDYTPAGLGRNAAITDRHLLARAQSGVTITNTVTRDAGAESVTSTVSLTQGTGDGTIVQRKFESGPLAGGGMFRFRLGDASAVANAWRLDALLIHYTPQEPR